MIDKRPDLITTIKKMNLEECNKELIKVTEWAECWGWNTYNEDNALTVKEQANYLIARIKELEM